MADHLTHAAQVRPAVPCAAHHYRMGGGCFNCGWAPGPVLVVEHLDTHWQVASVHRAPRGGGWPNVAALQSAKVVNNWHPPLYWSGRHERAVLIPRGVLLEKWQVDARAWMPFTRLTLED